MSVTVEFRIASEEFVFGSALETVEHMAIELEAIVPVGGRVVPAPAEDGGSGCNRVRPRERGDSNDRRDPRGL